MTIIFVFFTEAAAVPTKRHTGLFTLPIRSSHGHLPQDIHPQLYLQQHINRADRRLARMTGRAIPSDDELRARLHKRLYTAYRTNHRRDSYNTSSGVSIMDIQANITSTVSQAKPPTLANSMGLSIMAADAGYIAQLQIGTPPANFQVILDSGSADLWVGSEQCAFLNESTGPMGKSCGQHQFLGRSSSSTFVDTKRNFNVTYAVGFVSGTIVADIVTMAGLVLTNHSFGTADFETLYFSDKGIDGLMGLAQSSHGLSMQNVITPVEALRAQGLIPAAITSYKIPRLADQKDDGEVTFGALDPTKFDPTTLVTIQNNNSIGFWEVPMDAITVNGKDAGLKGLSAILDTGAFFINAPLADATAVHNLIDGSQADGQGGFTLPCTSNTSVALVFGGHTFTIDSRDLLVFPIDVNNPTGRCVSGIIGTVAQLNLGSNLWVVGDVFLKNAYFSTNIDNNTISLAKLV